jgi:hypothetical protein
MRRGTIGFEPPWIGRLKKAAREAVRDHVEALVEHCGGWEAVSVAKAELIYIDAWRWAVSTTVMVKVMKEGPIDPETGSLRKLVTEANDMLDSRSRGLERIGLTKEARKVENPLKDYLDARALPEPQKRLHALAGSESDSRAAGNGAMRVEGQTPQSEAFEASSTVLCERCGLEFEIVRLRGDVRRFCSAKCRRKAWLSTKRDSGRDGTVADTGAGAGDAPEGAPS